MLDVRRLRLLRELAHLGTIAAVAEALAFSPSAVSQQLSVLEREAGVPLLERTGRRVALTPAGRNLVRHTEAVLELLEQAGAELAHARTRPAGPLRIGAYPSAVRALLPAALAELASRHPELEAMVTEVDPAAVAGALRAGELDVALVHEYDLVPGEPEDGIALTGPVFAEPLYLAARSAGPLAGHRDSPWITSPHGDALPRDGPTGVPVGRVQPPGAAPGGRLRRPAGPGRGGPGGGTGAAPGRRPLPAGRRADPAAAVPAHPHRVPGRRRGPPGGGGLRGGPAHGRPGRTPLGLTLPPFTRDR